MGSNDMDQLMNIDALNQRDVGGSQIVEVLERCFVIDEFALERRNHVPNDNLGLSRVKVPKVNVQGGRERVVANTRAQQFEADEQAFFVVNDPGLSGLDVQGMSNSGADIADAQSEGERFRGLDFRRERVVCVNVALLKIFELELGFRQDGDRAGHQR